MKTERTRDLKKIRLCLGLVIFALVLSGLTAFPLLTELNFLVQAGGIDHGSTSLLSVWLLRVRDALAEADARFPFMAYGTDWLAFAHLVIAVFFVGPFRDPVRNIWIIRAGLVACAGVPLLALICGPVRGIPFFWRLIDCSFGLLGFFPLWFALRLTRRLQTLPTP